jgi:serine/threonine-protein kinase
MAFDLDNLTVPGGAVPLVQGVMRSTGGTGAANFSVADDGTLAYVVGGATQAGSQSLVWVDREGREESISAESSFYFSPEISPDGSRVVIDDRNQGNDLWVWDLEGETPTRLTVGEDGGYGPVWTSDGLRIAYSPRGESEPTINWKLANNTGRPEPIGMNLAKPDTRFLNTYFFSPSGNELVYGVFGEETGDDLGMITIGSDAEPVWLLQESYHEQNAELSPDGRWMVYQSDESGEYEIYVRPFPNVDDDQVRVSNSGGEKPRWSRDGRELFYLELGAAGSTDNRMISVSVDSSETAFSFSARTPILDWPYVTFGGAQNYDVSDDGRFLAISFGGNAGATEQIIVVQNWLEELRRIVPAE